MVMDQEWAPDPMTADRLGRPSVRLDIPVIDRRSLRDVADLLHHLANTLQRLSLNPPGETLRDRTALVMAQDAVRLANKQFLRMKKDDIAASKRNVIKFGTERKGG